MFILKEIKWLGLFFALLLMDAACSVYSSKEVEDAGRRPRIYPYEPGATIPCNCAPLNFGLKEAGEAMRVQIQGKNGELVQDFKTTKCSFEPEQWHAFLDANKGDSIRFSVKVWTRKHWVLYHDFSFFVSPDSIDSFLLYRLIASGYQSWNRMGIYQRELGSFREETVLDNKAMPHSCMNCHMPAMANPDRFVFHIRERHAGTFIYRNGEMKKLVARNSVPFKSVSFPAWHPSGRYLAFSINKIRQLFPSKGTERAHAFDKESDVVIYDVEKEVFSMPSVLYRPDWFEAFPCFSPDGKWLYYITAPAAPMPQSIRQIQYSLCRIAFNPETGMVAQVADTLITPAQTGKSLTMPRVSPDGNFVLLTFSDYGNFPAYNEESDLVLYSVRDSSWRECRELNSDAVESYHSWSSTGRWVVFSSRRMDGLHMNAYLAHFNADGTFDKPLLLPQADADFHNNFLYSFNLPEFIRKPLPVSWREIAHLAASGAVEVRRKSGTH